MASVGQRTDPRSGVVTAEHIRRYCAAIDEHGSLYLDRNAALAAGYTDVISPPLFNAAVTRPIPFRSGLVGDGQYDDLAPPGLNHLQTMLVGQSWELLRPAVAGETIVEVIATKSISEREREDGNMVFVEQEATIATVAGETIERYTSTLMLRQPPPALPPVVSSALSVDARDGAIVTQVGSDALVKTPDIICLFMFAASIWAVHRIHWDTPYAQSEGFRAPILPGWMLASYLAQLAGQIAPTGSRLSRLSVRYRASAFPGDTLRCTTGARRVDGAPVPLTITNQYGADLVTGEAIFSARA